MTRVTTGMMVTLEASDGFVLPAYRVEPRGEPRGGVVILQEIFGLNPHIRSVADTYARAGYLAVAPALYERVAPGAELGYAPAEIARGLELRAQCDVADVLKDIEAAVADAALAGRTAAIGYCWGGQLAWRAAAALPELSAAVVYYGGGIDALGHLTPLCPVLGHFARRDAHIPVDGVLAVQARHPGLFEVHLYDAGHGFNCDARESHDPAAAALALSRTLRFLDQRVAA
ncbi:dienelactone hydrolase family protein [Camelimonas abortus]|uniref:Dienelactone hydrolase family protein n=1 Tax=Camelimonas abortus TaxID=1017184 RepID=A0ABV7LC22_9HYPH